MKGTMFSFVLLITQQCLMGEAVNKWAVNIIIYHW